MTEGTDPSEHVDRRKREYQFSITDSAPSTTVVRAASFARNRDPLELTPLGEVIDPEVLDWFVETAENGTISFTWEGLRVEVTASREVVVTDPFTTSTPYEEAVDPSNVLVGSPDRPTSTLIEAVSVDSDPPDGVLSILVSPSPAEWTEEWDLSAGSLPQHTEIIRVGGSDPGGSAAGSSQDGTLETINAVSDPTDLSRLGTTVHERLTAMDGETVICFTSLSDLLSEVQLETAYRFLHLLTAEVRSMDATAYYHVNPREHDEETLSMLSLLFDATLWGGALS